MKGARNPKDHSETFTLKADEELRIALTKDEVVAVELISGFAEIFGFQLQKETRYVYENEAALGIFTFHGAEILLTGKMSIPPEICKDTPMILYLQVHAVLEELRQKQEEKSKAKSGLRGPNVMVVGPTDTGKSTFCRILLNYAVRMGRAPIFVDLDVGQGNISVPGSIGAVLVRNQVDLNDSFECESPLVHSFGHKSPGQNVELINWYISQLSETLRDRKKGQSGADGMVINTCGWIKGQGYDHLTHIAQAFEADVIIVLDEERLYSELERDLPQFVKVIWLPRSSGVTKRPVHLRSEARQRRIEAYFFGRQRQIKPFFLDLKFSALRDRIYRVGDHWMDKEKQPMFKIDPVKLNEDLQNHLLAVSFAVKPDDLTRCNVAGFLCVTKVDVGKEKMTVMSPQPLPLPEGLLILSDIKYEQNW